MKVNFILKKAVLLLLATPVLALLILIYFPMIKPVTDPDDPRFNPAEFQFKYYARGTCKDKDKNIVQCSEQFQRAIYKMFPTGTKKEDIDRILIEQAGGWSIDVIKEPGKYMYYCDTRTDEIFGTAVFITMVIYDKEMRSLEIKATFGLK